MAESKKDIRVKLIFDTLGGKRLINEINKMRLGMTNFASVTKRLGRSMAPNKKVFTDTANNVKAYGDRLDEQKEKQKQLLETSQRVARNQKQLNQLTKGSAQKLVNNTTATQQMAKKYDSLTGAMSMPMEQFSAFGKAGGTADMFSTAGGKIGFTVRRLTHGMRGFRMEMLGVMFFGMMLATFFSSLLKPAAAVYGIFDLWGSMLEIVFLPIMEALFPYFLKLIEYFMNLPEGVQLAIGAIVLIGLVLGKLLFIFGSIALGIGSVILAFGGLFGPGTLIKIVKSGGLIKWFVALIGGISATFLIVAAIVVAIVIGMYLAWKTNFLGMRKTVSDWIAAFKQTFGGLINIFKGVFMVLKGIFTGDFTLIKDGVVKIFKGLFDFIVGGFKMSFHLVVGIVMGALMIVYNIVKAVIDGIGWVAGKVGKFFGGSGAPTWKMPSFQTGGVMPYTGAAYLHKGETVTPAGRNSSGVVVNQTLNINVSDKDEIERMINDNNSKLVDDLRRMQVV